MAIKLVLVKSILLIGLPFYFLSLCTFLFIRVNMQAKPSMSITSLYHIEQSISNWLVLFLCIGIVSLSIIIYANRRMELLEYLDDFIKKEVAQRGQWLILLCATLVILEIVEGFSGNNSQLVSFENGAWVAYVRRSVTKVVTDRVAYDLVWGYCRLWSAVLVCLSSIALFNSFSAIKLINRTIKERRNCG